MLRTCIAGRHVFPLSWNSRARRGGVVRHVVASLHRVWPSGLIRFRISVPHDPVVTISCFH